MIYRNRRPRASSVKPELASSETLSIIMSGGAHHISRRLGALSPPRWKSSEELYRSAASPPPMVGMRMTVLTPTPPSRSRSCSMALIEEHHNKLLELTRQPLSPSISSTSSSFNTSNSQSSKGFAKVKQQVRRKRAARITQTSGADRPQGIRKRSQVKHQMVTRSRCRGSCCILG